MEQAFATSRLDEEQKVTSEKVSDPQYLASCHSDFESARLIYLAASDAVTTIETELNKRDAKM